MKKMRLTESLKEHLTALSEPAVYHQLVKASVTTPCAPVYIQDGMNADVPALYVYDVRISVQPLCLEAASKSLERARSHSCTSRGIPCCFVSPEQ